MNKEQSPVQGAAGTQRVNVVVLHGGNGMEREVSLRSGEGVAAALESGGATVAILDTAKRGDLELLVRGDFDVAFPALHGFLGEDGAIQGLLEVLGIPYVGSGIWSSATCMDKERTKRVYRAEGIPTPPSIVLYDAGAQALDNAIATVGYPSVIKPADGGSSRGLGRASNRQDLEAAVLEALQVTDYVMVEREVAGVAVTVGVMGNEDITAFPVLESRFEGEHDYESKIGETDRLTKICPTPILSDEQSRSLQNIALRAHRALGCRGMSRSDFMLSTDGQVWTLETNTLPGFTEFSSYPIQAKAHGLSYERLCMRLVELALQSD